MASLPSAVDRLRKHLASAIPDGGDRRTADALLVDVINSLHNGGGEDDEPEGKRQDPTLTSVVGGRGYDARPNLGGLGLDRFAFERRVAPKRTSAGLDAVLKGAVAPGRAEMVR